MTLSTAGVCARFAGCDDRRVGRRAAILGGARLRAAGATRPGDRAPSHRTASTSSCAEDLYEEVLRHFGYDQVPAQLPCCRPRPGTATPTGSWSTGRGAAAVAVGLAEVMTFAFIDPDVDAAGRASCRSRTARRCQLANPLAQHPERDAALAAAGPARGARGNLNAGERTLAVVRAGPGLRRGSTACRASASAWRWCSPARATAARWSTSTSSRDWSRGCSTGCRFPAVGLAAGRRAVARRGRGRGAGGRDGGRRSRRPARRGAASRWELRQPVYVAELELAAAPTGRRSRCASSRCRAIPSVAADMTVEHPAGLAFATLDGAVRELAERARRGGRAAWPASPAAGCRRSGADDPAAGLPPSRTLADPGRGQCRPRGRAARAARGTARRELRVMITQPEELPCPWIRC